MQFSCETIPPANKSLLWNKNFPPLQKEHSANVNRRLNLGCCSIHTLRFEFFQGAAVLPLELA
eukprot:3941768-Amphidinium_carterae.1